MVIARLYAHTLPGEQQGTLVAIETFSDYNAAYRRNPEQGKGNNYYVPTGTYGWQAWAYPLLQVGQYGVIATSGPRGVVYISIPVKQEEVAHEPAI